MLCVLGVGVKFPAKGFSPNNATGRQRLRTFDRTIQSCVVSHFKGKPELLLQIFPRIRTCLVSISRCSDCVKAIINDYATGPLQCELAADLQKSKVTAIYHLRIGKRFRNCSSKSAAGCLASWNASEN